MREPKKHIEKYWTPITIVWLFPETSSSSHPTTSSSSKTSLKFLYFDAKYSLFRFRLKDTFAFLRHKNIWWKRKECHTSCLRCQICLLWLLSQTKEEPVSYVCSYFGDKVSNLYTNSVCLSFNDLFTNVLCRKSLVSIYLCYLLFPILRRHLVLLDSSTLNALWWWLCPSNYFFYSHSFLISLLFLN